MRRVSLVRIKRKCYYGAMVFELQIRNYKGPARIMISLVTDEPNPKDHVHKLIGNKCKNGIYVLEMPSEQMTAQWVQIAVKVFRIPFEILLQNFIKSIRFLQDTRPRHFARDEKKDRRHLVWEADGIDESGKSFDNWRQFVWLDKWVVVL